MTIAEILAMAGFFLVAVGLGFTWVRNGRGQARRDGILEERINGIKQILDDENNGLSAIKKCVDEQKVHCASTVSAFTERIKVLEEQD